ncbi:AraC family transcriptional regulator [Asticcacaulis solisilvae]|uniref:AraC family transcriptional regulator n=1 Tax=Asticcacaulis solisilvae TaxID=1217274 RepID=UPI003FD85290
MAEHWKTPDQYDHVPRAVVGNAHTYPPSFEVDWHSHGRGQLVYAETGVVILMNSDGTWVAPPERAVWTPANRLHSLRTVGEVTTRSLLLDAEAAKALGDTSIVIAISPLVRQLLIAASDVPVDYDPGGRDGLVMDLLVAELGRAPRVPLSLPLPQSEKLAARCRAFLATPDIHESIDGWADAMGMDRRAFTRAFRKQTGLSFGAWRQQACLLVALPRLADGESVTTIALDMGYDSPAAFSTMFRRLLGVPPSRYDYAPPRAQHGEGDRPER